MNGNKPGAVFTSAFTKRLAAHPRIAYYPHPKCNALVTMVIDEVLVARSALERAGVRKVLEGTAEHVGRVLSKRDDDAHDVEIFQLREVDGKRHVADVAYAVWEARRELPKHLAGQVAPNHVLIAANYHTCPWGPPEEPNHRVCELGEDTGDVQVTVIDSGFVSGGPVDPRLRSIAFGSWFGTTPAGGITWVNETEALPNTDARDQNGDHLLDALAGHANFVAGVVAQACPRAQIDVVSHNGAFVDADDTDPVNTPLPTEASVARSLWETLDRGCDVVNVGFAFPTLPYAPPVGVPAGGPPSWTFTAVLDEFRDSEREFFVVAPAGNQNCIVPQYPAAFASSYDNVVGVGSVDAYGARSDFSNHGPWVACCTEGEGVDSTFVREWEGPTEEEESSGPYAGTRPPKCFRGWATWNGTSFAAPKVAGALAQHKLDHPGDSLRQAWDALRAAGTPAPSLQMGTLLQGLPPI